MFSRDQVFCLKIRKLSRAPTILQFNIFCLNFAHVFYLPMSTKVCGGFFLFYLDLELFAKIKKDLVFTHSFFTFSLITHSFFTLSLITQDLNKIKKTHTPFCRHYYVENVCKVSAKILKSMVVGGRQSFQFFRQKTWFLGNNRGLS